MTLVIHVAHIVPGFHLRDFLHPLRYWGYQFYSGVGSDISELALLGGLITIVRHSNCHARWCWRLGKHQVEGTPYRVCRKHHPDIPDAGASAEHIHRDARIRAEGRY